MALSIQKKAIFCSPSAHRLYVGRDSPCCLLLVEATTSSREYGIVGTIHSQFKIVCFKYRGLISNVNFYSCGEAKYVLIRYPFLKKYLAIEFMGEKKGPEEVAEFFLGVSKNVEMFKDMMKDGISYFAVGGSNTKRAV